MTVMDDSQQIRIFGIRHHGPGCARSLVRALEEWRPDMLLIEGPPEGESVLSLAADESMVPPVALLVYSEEEASRAVFYPFAEFSPEWQALRYTLKQGIPVRFMDLPVAVRFALDREEETAGRGVPAEMPLKEGEGDEEVPVRSVSEEPVGPSGQSEEEHADSSDAAENGPCDDDFDMADPLDWLGRAAGYESGESWWNHMVEERLDGLELFDAIREAMAAVRQEREEKLGGPEKTEALREAHRRGVRCLACACAGSEGCRQGRQCSFEGPAENEGGRNMGSLDLCRAERTQRIRRRCGVSCMV